MNKNITAIVFTKNEERRIPFIYGNFKNFCEIIVFDGGSNDGTEDFCKQNKIKFVSRPPDDSEMGLQALKWVYENTPTNYVIHVYCAHFFPQQLLDQFAQVADENQKAAVFHDVLVYRYGVVVHRPHFRRISSGCNFYKKSIINFKGSKIHDELAISFDAEEMIRLPGCDNLSLHLIIEDDCEKFTRKTIGYAVTEARQRFAGGERLGAIGVVYGPVARFLYRYIRLGSFSKGAEGLLYAILNFVYDMHVSIILWELTRNLTANNILEKNEEVRAHLLDDL